MKLDDFVIENQKVIALVKDRVPGDEQVDMYYGTLDYATARFNTILLKLSQDRLLEDEHMPELIDCFKAIQDFFFHVQRYRFWPKFTRFITRKIIHRIGTKRIPQIKLLLNRIEHNNKLYHQGDDTV